MARAPVSKFAYPRIVLYWPVSRSTELLAQFDAAVITSSHVILPRATELGSKMVASCSSNVRKHAVVGWGLIPAALAKAAAEENAR
jgi:hypothetical protein